MVFVPPKKIAVIGGGIAGLAAAQQLIQPPQNCKVTVFEASPRLGGALQTRQDNGFLIEHSADMFVSNPVAGIRLCQELGIANQLIPPNETNRFSSIVRRGQLIRIPQGFSLLAANKITPVLRSRLLSLPAKLRFLSEWFVRPNHNINDESLQSFAVRHYGNQTFERIIQPLVAGIYSADAGDLSMLATMSRFVEMEKNYGSLIRAARSENREKKLEQQSSGARYGLFVAPRNGMQTIVDALATSLHEADVHLATPVNSVSEKDFGWQVTTEGEATSFDAIVLTTGASVTARILSQLDSKLDSILASFKFGSMIIVTVACDQRSFPKQLPQGFGFVVPEKEKRELLACSFSSNKFPGRAPAGKFLMRCFIGGPTVSRHMQKSDDQLETLVVQELQKLIDYRPRMDDEYQFFRWQNCMPQYRVGHLQMIEELNRTIANHPGLQLAGCSYSGVGVPACIQSGQNAALKTLQFLELA